MKPAFHSTKSACIFAHRFAAVAIFLLMLMVPVRAAAQAAPRIIGRVEGDDFAIEADPGSPAAAIPTIAGQMLSGAHVKVNGGQARVSLDSGGSISVCGASRFQVISSNGAITIVLEYGELDLHFDAAAANVVIYTPLIVATPLSIGGGERETFVGLARSGDMCLRSPHGAARIEQQLSGQSLLVPQLGEISLSGGQVLALKSPNGQCACVVEEARLHAKRPASSAPVTSETMGAVASSTAKHESAAPVQPMRAPAQPSQQPLQAAPQIPIAAPAPSPGIATAAQSDPTPPPVLFTGPPVQQPPQAPRATAPAEPPETLAENEVPIYKVLVPPLTFDAFNPAPPPNPDPETIVLVRSVRVQQDVVFHDRVEGKGNQAAAVVSDSPANSSVQQPSRGFFASIGHFFHRIFS